MIKGASLFSNVGIDEHYLKEVGIEIVLSNELLEKRAEFYRHLYPSVDMVCGDITNLEIFDEMVKKFKDNNCKFLLATPPCQGMSNAGKKNILDIRNKLILQVIDFIDKTRPDNIIIENVPNLLKYPLISKKHSNNILIKDFIINSLKQMGYFINFKVLDAADYETPHFRKRAIFLISKLKPWEFPVPNKWVTLRDVISDLPSLESGEKSSIPFHFSKKHNERHILWMKNTPTGRTAHNNINYYPKKEDGQRIKGYMTTYKRMEWDRPAPTVTMANGSVSSQNNVHPGRELDDGTFSDARVLTVLELLRVIGLPDDWNIPEWASENLVRQVLGECFPPKFCKNLITTMPISSKQTNEVKNNDLREENTLTSTR